LFAGAQLKLEATHSEIGTQTRERLLDAAESLFAKHGFAATSVRAITAEVPCNLAAVNYHFGGKDQLYREMFHRRLGALREQRLATIRRAMKRAERPSLEELLRTFTAAFLEPYVSESDGRLWMRLVARELYEPHLPAEVFLEEIVVPVHGELAGALLEVCPDLDLTSARRATHSLIGQLTHFLHMDRYFSAAPGRLPGSLSLPELLDHVVTFSAAGIRSLAARNHRAGKA
jgi:TetR/AcrR family transcriptional regulator, regulator of cefoperazone and chloramphenicol sensitivity